MRTSWVVVHGSMLCAALLVAGVRCGGSAKPMATAQAPADADADGDGIPDSEDKCPSQREDGLRPNPRDGCPSDDPDLDGIRGTNDKCPFEPETVNGYEDQDGCPDARVLVTRAPRVTVTKTELKIDEKIQFATGAAAIDPKSNSLIQEIADVLKNNAQIQLVHVEGHADDRGNDAVNLALTKRRAESVVDALTKLGVDKARLRPVGYGRYCPLEQGSTDAAREANRRVQFKIVRIDGKDTGVEIGCAAAVAKGVRPPAS